MNPIARRLPKYTRLDEEQADSLSHSSGEWFPVEIHPPRQEDLPATIEATIRGVMELQSRWFGFKNYSPVVAFEIRRTTSDSVRLQFALPTKRLERKLRTHLSNEIPDIGVSEEAGGLPVSPGDSVGGAILNPGRTDWYPLRMRFDSPPMNSVVSALHRHAMQDTRILIQILFKPVVHHPIKSWWRTWRTYRHISYLRKRKEKLWGGRPPTPREKQQAKLVERKAGTPRFHTTIRLVVIGADEFTVSRVKELAGAFNIFENPDTGQYLDTVVVRSPLRSRIYRFVSAVYERRFGGWHRRFQVSIPELAGLVSIPDRNQENIAYAQP